MKKACVRLGKRSYDILVCSNEFDKLGRFISPLRVGTDAIIITNPKIKRLFAKRIERSFISAGFNVRFEIVPDSEKAKSERYCSRLLNSISKFDGSRRRVFIVALGGGVIGDLAGFVASIYKRGVPYIQVPTTLLAQVDSAIGGKVAIDLEVGKNLAGAFYQPRLVFSDVTLLRSLPKKDLVAGLAEVIKYGVIKSPSLFGFLEENHTRILKGDGDTLRYIVYACSTIKARVVEKDEQDNRGLRVVLNFGHTIGHAIEASAHYSKSYSHGQAVGLGMISASFIAKELGLFDARAYTRLKLLIKKLGLLTNLKNLDVKDIFQALQHDKKFIHGKNRFVLPVRIGKTVVKENIPGSLVRRSISQLFE
ncbi:MAG: 3-dehydroquinate synthase [Candidatus Omnitrophica bacterium]|nr:3-dehydroquinate synthase [Candidatus Omnitrophota bacterium]